jgi:NAD(P)-dependent dehydrogenase (short-subunit alcohol dehydrogenase family)
MMETTMAPDLRGKTIVITGANSGIGKVTTRELAKGGATVIMACRNMESANAVAEEIRGVSGNEVISVVHLDLASFASVHACAETIAASHDRIDVLLNNAGTYTQGNTTTADGIHPTMQANYFSPFLLTNLLLPMVKASKAGRIVNVSSAMYAVGRLDLRQKSFIVTKNGFSAYAASKLAMLLFTMELAERLAGSHVTANALHPGLVDTKIMRLDKWYGFFINRYMDWNAIDAEEGAKTSIYLSSSEEVAGVSGKYFAACAEKPANLSPRRLALQKPLWEKTNTIVGL